MYRIKISFERCTGDGECVEACPDELIELQEIEGKTVAVYTGDPDDCLGCEACVVACPEDPPAIEMEEE